MSPCFKQVRYSSVDEVAAAKLLVRGIVIKKDYPIFNTLAFSSELHAIHLRSIFCDARSRPPQTADGFENFIVDVVKRMGSKALNGALPKGVDDHVLERQYQVEFYRRVSLRVVSALFVAPF